MTDTRSSPGMEALRHLIASAIDSPTVAALADVFSPRNTQSITSKSYSEQITNILLPRFTGAAQGAPDQRLTEDMTLAHNARKTAIEECKRIADSVAEGAATPNGRSRAKLISERIASLSAVPPSPVAGEWKPVAQTPARGTDDAMLLYFPPSVTGAHQQSTLPAMYRTGHPDDFPNRKPSHFMLVGAPSVPSTEGK